MDLDRYVYCLLLLIAMICSAIIIEVGNSNAHWHWVGAYVINSHRKGQKNTLIRDKPLLFQIFGEQILEKTEYQRGRGDRSM